MKKNQESPETNWQSQSATNNTFWNMTILSTTMDAVKRFKLKTHGSRKLTRNSKIIDPTKIETHIIGNGRDAFQNGGADCWGEKNAHRNDRQPTDCHVDYRWSRLIETPNKSREITRVRGNTIPKQCCQRIINRGRRKWRRTRKTRMTGEKGEAAETSSNRKNEKWKNKNVQP